jgi:hypothetical protein
MPTCKLCGAEIIQESRSDRQFCSDAHKQKYWRQKHKEDQAEAQDDELTALRTKVADQGQRIVDLEQETIRLRALLDIERRYHADHERRSFKAWLRKQPAASIGALGQRILADALLPPLASRAMYEARLRSHKYAADELQEFAHLWKLMLLS